MIGKKTKDIEKKNNFKWYVEFKPKDVFGFDLEEHNKLMEIFITFLPNENIQILKLNNEMVEEIFELDYNEVLENIKLLGESKGKFFDGEDEISYSILTKDFFVTILQGMIFWSSGKELAERWESALKYTGLNFFEMSFVGGIIDNL